MINTLDERISVSHIQRQRFKKLVEEARICAYLRRYQQDDYMEAEKNYREKFQMKKINGLIKNVPFLLHAMLRLQLLFYSTTEK